MNVHSQTNPPNLGTRERIQEAAVELFSRHGFEVVSLRAITEKAKANLAAVNYHFGSKQGLVEFVIEELVKPVNEERLRRLEAVESSGETTVRELLRAFFEPIITSMRIDERSLRLSQHLMTRLFNQQPEPHTDRIVNYFRETVERYLAAFSKAMPGVDLSEIFWRLHFSYGVVFNTALHPRILEKISGGRVSVSDDEHSLERLLDFCEGGFFFGLKK